MNKKRKKDRGNETTQLAPNNKYRTNSSHYFSYIKHIIEEMDKHSVYKEAYIVMDNSPIHKIQEISKFIEEKGYHCVYLPPYSPDLNPIELFWAALKSRVKRELVDKEEESIEKFRDAVKSIPKEYYKNFCKHSSTFFKKCKLGDPL